MPTEQCNRVQVERYFLGESGTEEKRSLRSHLDGCEKCRGQMATLENERREYLLKHPFREFAARNLPGGKSARKTFLAPRWLPAVAGLAACLVLVPVVLRYGMKDKLVAETGVRTKGGPVLEYYLKRGGVVTAGQPSDPVRASDELQFVYAAGSHAYVTLASIDSRGHVSLYRADAEIPGAGKTAATQSGSVPEGAESRPLSQPAKPGEKQTLPFAVTLDDSPGSELFVMIYGAAPLTGSAVENWLLEAYTRAAGNLEGLTSLLPPPPGVTAASGSGSADGAAGGGKAAPEGRPEIKTLLLRKTQA